MSSRSVALISTFTALGVAFRVAKNSVTAVQFVNLPLVFGFTAAYVAGPLEGSLTTALTYLLSDLAIAPGAWTLVNMALGGLASALFGLGARSLREPEYRFALSFLLCFLFDVSTSALLYVAFGIPPLQAFLVGVVGLFLPVMGGYLVGVGPLTEASTSLLVTALLAKLERAPDVLRRS